MKLMLKSVFCLGIVMAMAGSVLADCDDCCGTCSDCTSTCTTSGARGCAEGIYACARPDFLPFGQGENLARDYMGQAHLQNLADLDDWNWVSAVAYEYQRSFSREKLGRYFSPSCCNNKFTVGAHNAGNDMRGEDIGLSQTFEGEFTLKPRIHNNITEPSFYLGMDRWLEGLFVWTKFPITYTKWEMDTCETSTQRGYTRFPINLMDLEFDAAIPGLGARTIDTIAHAFEGELTFGDKDIPLQAGRIHSNKENHLWGMADVPFHLGYNFLRKDRGTLGLYARVVFPTGTIEVNRTIFDPRVGYNRWQLGGGLKGRLRLYENDDQTSSFQTYLDVYVTHVFKDEECRLFDMKAGGTNQPSVGIWSRYLLLKQFTHLLAYTGRLRNFADEFTVCVKSGYDWLVDGLLFFEFKYNAWGFDLGYELKARDCEDFDCGCLQVCDLNTYENCDECCTSSALVRYGIKGVQLVNNTTVDPTATIYGGLAAGSGLAVTTARTFTTDKAGLKDLIDLESGRRPRAVSHKIFANVGYTWDVGEFKLYDNQGPIFMNAGAAVEFGIKNKALRHWDIFGKWGCAYN